jgi:hypothetical protein
VGCGAKFDVISYTDFAVLFLRDETHKHSTDTMRKFVPDWVHEKCVSAFLEGRESVEDMIRVVRNTVLDRLATDPKLSAEQRARTEEAWLSAWDRERGGTEIMPREYGIDEKYVGGVFAALRKDMNTFSNDPTADLKLWVETHPDDVFLYRSGNDVRAPPLAYTTSKVLHHTLTLTPLQPLRPFALGFTTEFCRANARLHLNGAALIMDGTKSASVTRASIDSYFVATHVAFSRSRLAGARRRRDKSDRPDDGARDRPAHSPGASRLLSAPLL